MANIGILHPGSMGILVAATAQNSGHRVYWISVGRSIQTFERAAKLGILDAGTLKELCATCEVIVSICPPYAAEEVAEQVAAHAFQGIYLEANAISPQRTIRIGERMKTAGARVVDGCIIGSPSWLYLSGEAAGEVAAFFSANPLETYVLDGNIGKASALKMCHAAYTKGTGALLCAILAAADALSVREDLEKEWSRAGSDFTEKTRARVLHVTPKAWRFAGEMDEIAATFREVGLPGEFHAAAGMIYRRMAGFKDASSTPVLEEVLEVLLHPNHKPD